MELRIREFTQADRDEMAGIWAAAFRSGRAYPEGEPLLEEDESAYVAEADGRIAGGFTIHDMKATRGDALLPCGGVASVAVAPEFRQVGIGGAMMAWAIERMRGDGYVLSSLYAYREAYYRKHGFECAGKRVNIQCPSGRLPSGAAELPVRRLPAENLAEVEGVYSRFAGCYSGMNARSAPQWARVVSKGESPPHVYAVGAPAEAYAVIRFGEFWGDQVVSEFAWASAAGYRSALALFRSVAANRSSMIWNEPGDGPFLATAIDHGVKLKLQRPIMYRVLDVPAALERLVPGSSGDFAIEVLDEAVPGNRGPWRVAFGAKGVQVAPCGSADIRLDIRHFTQALLGEPDIGRLAAHGLVEAGSDAALRKASALLTANPTYCMDFF